MAATQRNNDDECYVYPVWEGKAFSEHDEDHPFCNDLGSGQDCPCRDDEENRELLQDWYDNGLIGSVDGDLIYHGKTI
jgi:hypothetical protein